MLVETATYVRYRQHNCRYCRWLHSLTGPYILTVRLGIGPTISRRMHGISPTENNTRRRDGFEAQQIAHTSPQAVR